MSHHAESQHSAASELTDLLEGNDDAVLLKLVAAGAGVAATWLANSLIRHIWKHTTGHDAPKNASDPGLGVGHAVAFAALSAAVAVLAKRVATHGAKSVLHALSPSHKHGTDEVIEVKEV